MTTSDTSSPRRFQYSASYADPKRFHIGSADWMPETECRTAVAAMLRNPDFRKDSIRISVQQKKSRWLPLTSGPVGEIFPDLEADFIRDTAVAAILADPGLPVRVRAEIAQALRRGLPAAIAEARQLVAALEAIEALPPPASAAAPSVCGDRPARNPAGAGGVDGVRKACDAESATLSAALAGATLPPERALILGALKAIERIRAFAV